MTSKRWLLIVGAAMLLTGKSRPAAGASATDCRTFHQECMDAKAAGYRDVGICHVEQLECRADGDDVSIPRPSYEAPVQEGRDPERAVGERAIGP